MNKLANWPKERERVLIEEKFVSAKGEQLGITSEYTSLRLLSVAIKDTMYAFECARMYHENGDTTLVTEAIEQCRMSHGIAQLINEDLPDRFARLQKRIRRTARKKNRVGIPELYRMVGKVERLALNEKRLILGA